MSGFLWLFFLLAEVPIVIFLPRFFFHVHPQGGAVSTTIPSVHLSEAGGFTIGHAHLKKVPAHVGIYVFFLVLFEEFL